jgi:hypothetical protein
MHAAYGCTADAACGPSQVAASGESSACSTFCCRAVKMIPKQNNHAINQTTHPAWSSSNPIQQPRSQLFFRQATRSRLCRRRHRPPRKAGYIFRQRPVHLAACNNSNYSCRRRHGVPTTTTAPGWCRPTRTVSCNCRYTYRVARFNRHSGYHCHRLSRF